MFGGRNGEGKQAPPSTEARPRIRVSPRASMESVFNGGATVGFSPGPMTLVSGLFGDNDEWKSFSELLAGGMVEANNTASPVPTFTLPPGLSPARFLHSPAQGHFGMTQEEAVAQVTNQAVQTHSNAQIQAEHPFSVSAFPTISFTQVSTATSNNTQQLIPPPLMPDSEAAMIKPLDYYSHSEQKLHSSSVNVDKPNDDGYNWRKYGQKHVKGSDFPRSYYKCTHPKCLVKKKVERSLEGHVIAIIYKGEHSHQPPHPNKLSKLDTLTTSNENSHSVCKMDVESSTSDSEEVGDDETQVDEKNDEPDPKRRNIDARLQDAGSLHKTVTEPRIIVQTTSDVDLLDDGYRWRKYGQKVVKGNPYPRSYYKCTTTGCTVRKHVERASSDPKAVITTYEGKHSHDVPAAKTNSHTLANNSASQLKAQNATPEKHSFSGRGIGGNNEQRYVASLKLKEEQII